MQTIRLLLTLSLIYGVYTETGIWTAISILLIFIAIEAFGKIFRDVKDLFALVGKYMELNKKNES